MFYLAPVPQGHLVGLASVDIILAFAFELPITLKTEIYRSKQNCLILNVFKFFFLLNKELVLPGV